ncbi:putative ATP-dependent RNA helicase dbp2 [Blattamonas nauphoetae]|uniref:RNA helicase n=1 Tax=Blattamonas nauphoetae TaxID=2049346 RepID=A0ABQ9Y179_9EUKA|nr:putative ATP-dependent RNA helicase dbp2 [Blattamonas nauphoetae]
MSWGGSSSHFSSYNRGYEGRFDPMSSLGSSLPRTVDFSDQPTVQKDFYKEHPDVSRMSADQVREFYQKNDVIASGTNVPKPILEFYQAQFNPEIDDGLRRAGFSKPTLIQQISWPAALSGQDLIGIAETGSGKTLAYALPALIHIAAQPPVMRGDGPIAVCLAPTRELALQIEQEIAKYAPRRVRVTTLYGGVPRGPQIRSMQSGVEICIATPGRLIDLLESNATNLRRTTFLVLDEADRMLDIGFEPQLRKIVSQIRKDRQTLMWSATWPREVQQLANDFLNQSNLVRFNIGSLDMTANERITQEFIFCSAMEKEKAFLEWLRKNIQNGRMLIFANTKRDAENLTRILRSNGINALSLHGDKSQGERDWVMAEFKAGKAPMCVATDVASRGIDVKDIMFVVNYDIPKTIEDYIHRIGRTGRASRSGCAVSFFTPEDNRMAKDLINNLREVHQPIPPELFNAQRDSRNSRGGGGGNRGRFGQRGGYGGRSGSNAEPVGAGFGSSYPPPSWSNPPIHQPQPHGFPDRGFGDRPSPGPSPSYPQPPHPSHAQPQHLRARRDAGTLHRPIGLGLGRPAGTVRDRLVHARRTEAEDTAPGALRGIARGLAMSIDQAGTTEIGQDMDTVTATDTIGDTEVTLVQYHRTVVHIHRLSLRRRNGGLDQRKRLRDLLRDIWSELERAPDPRSVPPRELLKRDDTFLSKLVPFSRQRKGDNGEMRPSPIPDMHLIVAVPAAIPEKSIYELPFLFQTSELNETKEENSKILSHAEKLFIPIDDQQSTSGDGRSFSVDLTKILEETQHLSTIYCDHEKQEHNLTEITVRLQAIEDLCAYVNRTVHEATEQARREILRTTVEHYSPSDFSLQPPTSKVKRDNKAVVGKMQGMSRGVGYIRHVPESSSPPPDPSPSAPTTPPPTKPAAPLHPSQLHPSSLRPPQPLSFHHSQPLSTFQPPRSMSSAISQVHLVGQKRPRENPSDLDIQITKQKRT